MNEILLLLSKYFYCKPLDLRKILERFPDLKQVMEAPKDAFLKLGIHGKPLDEFIKARKQKNIETKKQENEYSPSGVEGLPKNEYSPSGVEGLPKNEYSPSGVEGLLNDIKITTILDADYPAALKNIYDPPPVIFYKGNLELISSLSSPCNQGEVPEGRRGLAVIGSRKITEYGRHACEILVKDLCQHFIIISGLAYGVDGLSHEITVKNKQKTIGVLGSGLDDASIYPKTNVNLAKKILDCGGLLLSEVPPGIGPQKFHFPMRNRIIAGLSEGILIIEGGIKSGTLITAKLGLEYGADIFCVPGNIFSPNSEGVNYLIKFGAHPVTEARDILEFYGMEVEDKKEYEPKTEKEKIILKILTEGERHANEIAKEMGEGIMETLAVLTDLEMAGVVKNAGGKFGKI